MLVAIRAVIRRRHTSHKTFALLHLLDRVRSRPRHDRLRRSLLTSFSLLRLELGVQASLWRLR